MSALQGQLTALQQVNQNLQNQLNAIQNALPQLEGGAGAGAGVALAPLPGGANPTRFSLMPATTNLEGLIDYSSKLGQSIYKQGCQKLTKDEGFQMTPSTTAAFVKTFENCCSIMGWNQGVMRIAKFPNQQGLIINIVKNYGQIDEPTLKAHSNKFCKAVGAKFETRAAQNNHMMVQRIKKSLTVDSLAHLEPYQSQYMFEGVEYWPLIYKTIMRLATIDSVTTTETLRANLNNLPSYTASVNGDVDLINSYFDTNYTQILGRGATVDDPIAKLFDVYLSIPDYNFKQNISKKQDDYHDGNLGASFTHKNLMAQATAKFTYLKIRQIKGAKSLDEEKLIAMIADLKGNLKLAPNLEKKKKKKKDNKAKDKDDEGSTGGGDYKKKKNKKDTSNKKNQKKEEAWKRVPPKEGKAKEKIVKEKTYHWCKHHMAWGIHPPKDCCLGLSRKDAQRAPQPMTAATAIATIARPSFAAFLSELSNDE